MSTLPKEDPIISVGQVFTPSSPVEIKQLFAGRSLQMNRIMDILQRKGQHAIIYGDRGVGKTSFANIIKILTESGKNQVVKVQCDSRDTFETLWQKILERFSLKLTTIIDNQIGYVTPAEVKENSISLFQAVSLMPMNLGTILRALETLDAVANGVVIIDEFDRLEDANFDKKLFADLIKTISDNLPNFKIILVAVAEDVASLIAGHESIERNLSQVYMPVMTPSEIREIVTKGADRLNICFTEEVTTSIIQLSAGYPHFTHSLCYHAANLAALTGNTTIDNPFLNSAITETIDGAQESLRNAFIQAVWTTQKRTIFKEVLYAASMVKTDAQGYFQASDLIPILTNLLKKPLTVGHFMSHLKKFCEAERGEILKVTGSPKQRKYKFRNPLMKAFVMINKVGEENKKDE